MNFGFPAVFGVLFFLTNISPAFAQSPDSAIYHSSADSLQLLYMNEIGDNAQIYHGSEFIRSGVKATGFPFFGSDSFLNGSVSYQGTTYLNRILQYNLVTDELITSNYQHSTYIVLSSEKIDSFRIGNHKFIKLRSDKTNGLTKTGFYEQLVDGEPGFYVNRYKKFVTATGSIDTKYTGYNEYYVRMNNVYYPVTGKSDLLELFGDQKESLKKFIRANKIKFNKNLESSMVLTTIYYSRLKH